MYQGFSCKADGKLKTTVLLVLSNSQNYFINTGVNLTCWKLQILLFYTFTYKYSLFNISQILVRVCVNIIVASHVPVDVKMLNLSIMFFIRMKYFVSAYLILLLIASGSNTYHACLVYQTLKLLNYSSYPFPRSSYPHQNRTLPMKFFPS